MCVCVCVCVCVCARVALYLCVFFCVQPQPVCLFFLKCLGTQGNIGVCVEMCLPCRFRAIAKKDTQVKKLQPRPVVARGGCTRTQYVHKRHMGIIYTQKAHKPKVTEATRHTSISPLVCVCVCVCVCYRYSIYYLFVL